MPKSTLLKIALLVVCCVMTMAGQKKPAQQPRAASEKSQPGNVDKNKGNEEKNKTTARRVMEEIWGQGRAELVSTMYEPNAIVHWGNRNLPLQEMVTEGKDMRSAFPDLSVRVNRVSANGDIVDVQWSAHGTNSGKGMNTPGKGKKAKSQGMSKFRFDREGKIAEVWVEWDQDAVRKQVAGK